MITFTKLGSLGRLGNQLFQLAAAIALALRNDDEFIFPPWEYEPYFNLHGCFRPNIHCKTIYSEPTFSFNDIPYQKDMDLFGYFQSENYFKDEKSIVTQLLTPKLGFGIQYGQTSVHVRRGDYISNNAYHPVGMEYYLEAMAIAKAERYVIFSDDIAWCKKHFIGNQFIFSENNSPADDMAHMISCENNIITNSSFSWWGAYLNKNPSKTVIAPKKWFGPALSHDTKDLIPKEWARV